MCTEVFLANQMMGANGFSLIINIEYVFQSSGRMQLRNKDAWRQKLSKYVLTQNWLLLVLVTK